jgi:hypothetical protein
LRAKMTIAQLDVLISFCNCKLAGYRNNRSATHSIADKIGMSPTKHDPIVGFQGTSSSEESASIALRTWMRPVS